MPPTPLRDWWLSAASLFRWLTGTEQSNVKASKAKQNASVHEGHGRSSGTFGCFLGSLGVVDLGLTAVTEPDLESVFESEELT